MLFRSFSRPNQGKSRPNCVIHGPTWTLGWTHTDSHLDLLGPPTQPQPGPCTAIVQTLHSLWSRPYIALHSICIATAQHMHSHNTELAQHCIAMYSHKSTELAQAPEPLQQHQALQSLRTKDSEGPDEAQETAMEPNRRSWNIMECHGTLWNLMESYRKLWKVMESYGIV